MRILHTSDWHIGKRLGRFDRMEEHAAAVGEVIAIAEGEGADLVVHSGDLFDRAAPPVEALRVALEGLVRLADGGRRPVVVVAGNHDSADLFEVLAPYLRDAGVHLVGRIKAPDDGGVVDLDTPAGPARIGCFPFLRAAQAVDFMERAEGWYRAYADRVRRIAEVYATAIGERDDAVGILAGHWMVGGVSVRRGVPRGERELHMGEAYAATADSIPTSLDYVALGHIHAPQPVPGSGAPAQYAGSLLQLDFGEAGEDKRVVVVDADPGVPATVRSVPITAGRRLERVRGTWEEISQREGLEEAYLDLTVLTGGPDPEIVDLARDRFERVVKVQTEYERPDAEEPPRSDRPLDELYADFHLQEHGQPLPDATRAFFTELEDSDPEPESTFSVLLDIERSAREASS
ncbi:MAG: exonuclease SbcCD subunit D [Acidimicrobiia bacterium]|nr:exonuclease SbcCD subunit D [Acidimicrobiia bacterium]